MNNITFNQIPSDMLNQLMANEKFITENLDLPYSTLEILRYYISTLNGCAYCADMHYKEAVNAGVSPQTLQACLFWQEMTEFTAQQQSLFAWAKASCHVTQSTKQQINQSFVNLTAHFSIEQITLISFCFAQINSWNTIAKTFSFSAGEYQVQQS